MKSHKMEQFLCCDFQQKCQENSSYVHVPSKSENETKYGLTINKLHNWMLYNYPDNNVTLRIFDLNSRTYRYDLALQLHGTAMVLAIRNPNINYASGIVTKSNNGSTIITVKHSELKETIVCELYSTMIHERKLFDFNRWDFSGWLSFVGQIAIPIAISLSDHKVNCGDGTDMKNGLWTNVNKDMLINP